MLNLFPDCCAARHPASAPGKERELRGCYRLCASHTLSACAAFLLQEFKKLALAMINKDPVEEGPPPPNQLTKQWSLVPPVVADGVPSGGCFAQAVGQLGGVSAVRVEEGRMCSGGWSALWWVFCTG